MYYYSKPIVLGHILPNGMGFYNVTTAVTTQNIYGLCRNILVQVECTHMRIWRPLCLFSSGHGLLVQGFLFYPPSHPLKKEKKGKLSKLKSREIWETVQSGDDPPPPLRGWDFFELKTFLKWVDPPPLKSTWDLELFLNGLTP